MFLLPKFSKNAPVFPNKTFLSTVYIGYIGVLLLISGFLSFFYIRQLQIVSAANSPWNQSDWSGGMGSSTIDEYSANSSTDTTLVPGQVTLSTTSGWYDTAWDYRVPVVVTNSSGSSLSDMQVMLSVNTSSLISSGKLQDNCEDLRVTTTSGTPYSYWIETGLHGCDATSTYVWIKVPTLSTGATSVHVYYGNATAVDAQDGDLVFAFFDDFDDGSIDAAKWTQGTIGGTSGTIFTEASGYLSGGNNNRYIQSVGTFTGNYITETRIYEQASAANGFTSTGFWANINNGFGILIHAGTTYVRNDAAWPNIGVFSIQQWARDKVKVVGTSGYASRTSEVTQQVTYTAANSGISNEYLRLGPRYDSSNVYNQNYVANWDWIFVRKAVSTEPTAASPGSEENKYVSEGTLTSNIFDAELPMAWGNLTYVFSAPSNTTLQVKVRSGNQSNLSDADDWGSCATRISGNDLSGDCTDDGTQYIQYQVTLSTTDASVTPTFFDIDIAFSAYDTVRPDVNASDLVMYKSNGGDAVSSNSWTNNDSPYYTWSSGSDNLGGSGERGYCLYVGDTLSGNPEINKGLLGTSPEPLDHTTCRFIVTGNSVDFSEVTYKDAPWLTTSNDPYYFNIKIVDQAGNVYAGTGPTFQFRYDGTKPTNVSYISTPSGNFSNVVDMFFTWPAQGTVTGASDNNSGLLGYQYQINSISGDWLGTETDATCGLRYIPAGESSYAMTEAQDEANIVSGNNVIYFRSVDTACNTSDASTYRTGSISYGGDAPYFGGGDSVTVTDSTATSNFYALSWPAARTDGEQVVTHYYYMINTPPPTALSTLQNNASTYFDNGTNLSVAAAGLPNVNKGSNTVYVVAIDGASPANYSPSNFISGTFTLNSTNPNNVVNLVASDSSIKSEEQWNVALTWVAPTYLGAGNLTYLIYRSSDGSSYSQVGSTAGLSYVDNTFESTKYYYKIYSKDGANALSSGTNAVEITPTGKWTSPPTLESDPEVTNITTKRATITWSTSRTADSKVSYGSKSKDYYTEEPSNSDQVTFHEIKLTNLNPGTNYYYKAKWTDEDGNLGTSDEFKFTTLPSPQVTDPKPKYLGIDRVTLEFTVKGADKVRIYYGLSPSFGYTHELSTSNAEATYNTSLENLTDGSKYFYKINTFDSEDDEYEGNTLTFETLPRPKISNVTIQQVKGTAQTTVLVTWSTNTEVSSIISYYPSTAPESAQDQINSKLVSGRHNMVIQNLLPTTTYALVVKGVDKAGNEAKSEEQYFTTATDTRPPLVSNVKIESDFGRDSIDAITTQLVVNWNTDEAATTQVEYGEGSGAVYSNKTQEDSDLTFNHVAIIQNLTASKVYHLRVVSADSNGNKTYSVDFVTITPKATDNALDLVIGNLQQIFGFIGDVRTRLE